MKWLRKWLEAIATAAVRSKRKQRPSAVQYIGEDEGEWPWD